jgi:hypothetical protein
MSMCQSSQSMVPAKHPQETDILAASNQDLRAEITSIETKPKVDLFRIHTVTPQQVWGLFDLCQVRV